MLLLFSSMRFVRYSLHVSSSSLAGMGLGYSGILLRIYEYKQECTWGKKHNLCLQNILDNIFDQMQNFEVKGVSAPLARHKYATQLRFLFANGCRECPHLTMYEYVTQSRFLSCGAKIGVNGTSGAHPRNSIHRVNFSTIGNLGPVQS